MKNPELTRQYVEEAILPIQDVLKSMDEKINILLPKGRYGILFIIYYLFVRVFKIIFQ